MRKLKPISYSNAEQTYVEEWISPYNQEDKGNRLPDDSIREFVGIIRDLEHWFQNEDNQQCIIDKDDREELVRLVNSSRGKSDDKLYNGLNNFCDKFEGRIDTDSLKEKLTAIRNYIKDPQYQDCIVFNKFCTTIVLNTNNYIRAFQIGTRGKHTSQALSANRNGANTLEGILQERNANATNASFTSRVAQKPPIRSRSNSMDSVGSANLDSDAEEKVSSNDFQGR